MTDWNTDVIDTLAKQLLLVGDPRRRRLGTGWQHAHAPGSSLEFHDYRSYAPGDDPRRVDWRVFARSGQLVLRRHRAEIQQQVHIILDASASMGIHPEKWQAAVEAAALLATIAQRGGGRVLLTVAQDTKNTTQHNTLQSSRTWAPLLRSTEPAGAAGLTVGAGGSAAGITGEERILISDGLLPQGVTAARHWLRGAGSVSLVQVLTADERQPSPCGPVELHDVEGGRSTLIIDERACIAYQQRLQRLHEQWRQALRGVGGDVIACRAEDGIHGVVRAAVRNGLLLNGAAS